MADAIINPAQQQQVQPPRSGPELDAGKSTVRGDTNYTEGKGKSVITDADTVVDIADILAKNQKNDISVDKMCQELEARGYDVELTNVDGKKALRFLNGDVFVDSSGDGALGNQDVKFDQALGKIEARFGVNLDGLQNTMEALEIQHKLKKEAKKMGEAGMYGYMFGGQGLQPGQQPAFAPTGPDDLAALLDEVDGHLRYAGYEGQETAHDLWRTGALNGLMAKLGVNFPIPIPQANDVAFDMAMTRAVGLFGLAHSVAANQGKY